MATLVHEVWIDDEGKTTCCLAGPMGDAIRLIMAEDRPVRLIRRFVAGSHFEAMTIYNRLVEREPYTTDQQWDHQPYPNAWLLTQERAGITSDGIEPL